MAVPWVAGRRQREHELGTTRQRHGKIDSWVERREVAAKRKRRGLDRRQGFREERVVMMAARFRLETATLVQGQRRGCVVIASSRFRARARIGISDWMELVIWDGDDCGL
ncbi:hypothetical protein M0R45_035897 [Rubus argutus]|uniref:Uncharacterized protein n=1 Tax=Rubus argutus TaxID=59490 RepID=A0AAW1VYS5_RUBAR